MVSAHMATKGRLHYSSIGMAAMAIAGLPAAWNLVARNEYRRHTIERILGGRRRGAYLLAVAIFLCSGLRDGLFKSALDHNPSDALPIVCSGAFGNEKAALVKKALSSAGVALMAAGSSLVLSSFARLGITGTYLGDYFGILMEERVTAFPFNILENPMYVGSTLNFLGAAVAANSAVGVALTAWVATVYHVSTVYFENPFTAMIYRQREAASEPKSNPSKREKKA